jgi:4a-hydroxytetrahydrobiopterin dehydratase
MASELAQQEWVPCRKHTAPLKEAAIKTLLEKLGGNWEAIGEHRLEKEYRFKDVGQALEFTNRAGELAERLDHHPDIHLAWGKVRLGICTHALGGLCPSDFVFAAKADALA